MHKNSEKKLSEYKLMNFNYIVINITEKKLVF